MTISGPKQQINEAFNLAVDEIINKLVRLDEPWSNNIRVSDLKELAEWIANHSMKTLQEWFNENKDPDSLINEFLTRMKHVPQLTDIQYNKLSTWMNSLGREIDVDAVSEQLKKKFNSEDRSAAGDGGWSTHLEPIDDVREKFGKQ